ncbi:MAG: hypothetical protein ACRD5G_07140 [Candidatus Acidiferrales bacterium]
MKHLNEEQLILHFYRESGPREAAEAEEHLAACEDCCGRLAALKVDLAAVEQAAPAMPERNEGYGGEVWQRVRPRLGERPEPLGWRSWFAMPQLAWAGAMAALLLVAFLAGTYSNRSVDPGTGGDARDAIAGPGALRAEQVGRRVLNAAVGDHLERSQMLLVELSNAPARGPVDISTEQQWAGDLLDSNRLYRETAASTGEAGLSAVLDELERVLIEVRNRPASMSPAEMELVRQRIDGTLFKVRVLGSQMREQERQEIAERSKISF